jgi:hypothetical protein
LLNSTAIESGNNESMTVTIDNTSCKTILESDSSSLSGIYLIDPLND